MRGAKQWDSGIIFLQKVRKFIFKDVSEMQTPIEPAASHHQSRRVGFEQLDDGIGCIFARAVLGKTCKKRTRSKVGNVDKSPEEIIRVEVPAFIAAPDCAPHQGANRFMRSTQEASNILLLIAVRST
jgi:hypothetical protein